MLDWIERLIEAADSRIQHGLVIAIAFFLAMALKDDELIKEENHDNSTQRR